MSFTARAVTATGAVLALLGALLLPARPVGAVALIDFGLGMCAAVGIVWADARSRRGRSA